MLPREPFYNEAPLMGLSRISVLFKKVFLLLLLEYSTMVHKRAKMETSDDDGNYMLPFNAHHLSLSRIRFRI